MGRSHSQHRFDFGSSSGIPLTPPPPQTPLSFHAYIRMFTVMFSKHRLNKYFKCIVLVVWSLKAPSNAGGHKSQICSKYVYNIVNCEPAVCGAIFWGGLAIFFHLRVGSIFKVSGAEPRPSLRAPSCALCILYMYSLPLYSLSSQDGL